MRGSPEATDATPIQAPHAVAAPPSLQQAGRQLVSLEFDASEVILLSGQHLTRLLHAVLALTHPPLLCSARHPTWSPQRLAQTRQRVVPEGCPGRAQWWHR